MCIHARAHVSARVWLVNKSAATRATTTQELMDFNAQLSKGRKKRALPPTLATPDDFGAFSLASSNPLHKTTQV